MATMSIEESLNELVNTTAAHVNGSMGSQTLSKIIDHVKWALAAGPQTLQAIQDMVEEVQTEFTEP